MSEDIIQYNKNQIDAARVLIEGDLGGLTAQERATYYVNLCNSLGLNPLTKPFEFMKLQGKMILYAKRECTEQLRKIHGVSIKIISRERIGDCYVVTAQACDKIGRTDESTGAVNIYSGMTGEAVANALMKAETKAKRRVTLSICGLGFLEEEELETTPYNNIFVNTESGEIIQDIPYKDYPSENTLQKLKDFFSLDLSEYLSDDELSKLKKRYEDTINGVKPDKTNKEGGYTEERVNQVLGFWIYEYNKRKTEHEEMLKLKQAEIDTHYTMVQDDG